MNKKSFLIRRHVAYILAICLLVFVFKILKITCPILFLFGVPCPTCGVTRAVVCFIKFDFQGYLYYHPLALLLVMAVLLMLHLKLFKRKKLTCCLACIILAFNLLLYIFRFNELMLLH